MSPTSWRDLTERHLATAVPRSLLLIEDDDFYVSRMRTSLIEAHPQSFRLEVCRTLTHAELALSTSTFDLILLDLGLPDSHGLSSFERIHRAARNRPVVVITSSDDPELAARLLYLGAQDYLVKGASDDLLMHVIGRAISRSAPDASRLPVIDTDQDGREPLSERDRDSFDAAASVRRVAMVEGTWHHRDDDVDDPDTAWSGNSVKTAATLSSTTRFAPERSTAPVIREMRAAKRHHRPAPLRRDPRSGPAGAGRAQDARVDPRQGHP